MPTALRYVSSNANAGATRLPSFGACFLRGRRKDTHCVGLRLIAVRELVLAVVAEALEAHGQRLEEHTSIGDEQCGLANAFFFCFVSALVVAQLESREALLA